MQTFEFHLDKKVTSWYRETHYVDAETLQEAQKIMIINFMECNTDNTFSEMEEIPDTWEDITPKENGHEPTQEVWCEDSGMLLIDNVAKQPMI